MILCALKKLRRFYGAVWVVRKACVRFLLMVMGKYKFWHSVPFFFFLIEKIGMVSCLAWGRMQHVMYNRERQGYYWKCVRLSLLWPLRTLVVSFPQALYLKFAKQKNTCLIDTANFVILTEMSVAAAYWTYLIKEISDTVVEYAGHCEMSLRTTSSGRTQAKCLFA